MDYTVIAKNYCNAVLETDRDSALRIIEDAMVSGSEPEKLIFEVVLPSLDQMLQQIAADDEATLSQHFITAKVSEEAVDKLLSRFSRGPSSSGVIVLGCAQGDFHGLGKKIVAGCLRAHMYTVHDAGLNVAPGHFVNMAEETGATIIGVSSMMMHTTIGENGPKGVRKELQRRKLENKIRLIVGGAPYLFDPDLYQKVAADAFAKNALEAVVTISALCERSAHHA